MTRCLGWDAPFLPSRLATVRDTFTASPLRLGSGALSGADMASFPLRTGLAIALAIGLLCVAPLDALARGSGGHSSGYSFRSSSSGHTYRSPAASSHSPSKCLTCERDSHGKIKRDPKAVEDFKRTHPRPPGCSGCEVDHIVPLSKGGRDDPGNMQWLPREQHQDKTRRDLGP